jgi:hypothetical protein
VDFVAAPDHFLDEINGLRRTAAGRRIKRFVRQERDAERLDATPDARNFAAPVQSISGVVTSLFLLWGFCNGMIDILNKHFQDSLHINKEQSGLVQFANYLAYFLMAIPAGLIARKFGYKGGILVGLCLIASGAFWFIHAVSIGTYWAFLLGLFVIAAGMTCLETIANPYTTVLGRRKAARRASTSPKRSTAWAGFSVRLSADTSFSEEVVVDRATPLALPLQPPMPHRQCQCRACPLPTWASAF